MAIRAVGGVAFRSSRAGLVEVLLIRKHGGLWTLPKGQVKRGEADEEALLRELREETGLGGRVLDAISQSSYRVLKGGRLKRKIVVYYLVLAERGELRPGVAEGIEEVRWMYVPEALQQIGRPRVKAVLRSALTHLNP